MVLEANSIYERPLNGMKKTRLQKPCTKIKVVFRGFALFAVLQKRTFLPTNKETHEIFLPFFFLFLKVHRFPIIYSGDIIALRSAHSSYSSKLLWCSKSYCKLYSCSGRTMSSSAWSSCSSYSMFKIFAMGKWDGEPINSGDTVSLLSYKAYGSSYWLRCSTSSSTYCCVQS